MNAPLPDGLKFDSDGLIPAIITDHQTREVLMMAWMNRDSLAKTIETNQVHFYSRSRSKLWLKGESSGNVQNVHSISTDCDADVLLIAVEQIGGAACHEGYRSCFFRKLDASSNDWKTQGERVFDPAKVYAK